MTSAARILDDLRQAGIEPEVLDGNRLAVPAGVLSDDMRHAIRTHKAELIELLLADHAALAARYYLHHFSCATCIAAGQNPHLARCAVGLPLWRVFQSGMRANKQHVQSA
ncbi:hypothetical protein BN940_07011 [Castellaniella defragrans 65Phen]|uniref:TubC N-terminal docking domain-containing protein n=1 Tax=Castellaniella defragrans (strain DSM 12143 / CCUG 39792 / 65Phen) TaxID=1437824 RepID=W8WWD0_CASD6|nr:hypothetical protein [Castellaniella defragrans]CDM23869.1 hypothetical protein BN940_07011 [Castellaniella defragrans 65Phen]